MACQCISDFNGRLKAQNLRVNVALFHIGSKMFARPYLEAVPLEKKRGAKPATILPQYCPFCGTGYDPVPDAALPDGEARQ